MGFSLQKGEKGGIISPVYAAGPASGVQREGGNSMGSFQSWLNQLNYEKLLELAITLVAAMVCIIPHEVSHGYAAYRLGDPTAKNAGRLTMNPLRHIDWFGLLMMITVGFGWAKPVPVDPRYFRRPKQGMALTALAGPVSNFLLALVLLFAGRLVYDYAPYSAANQRLLTFLLTTAILSLGLGLFNLIPIPPLDGSKVLFSLLPDRAYNTMLRYERYGMLLLWAVVLLGVGDRWMSAAIQWTYELFCRVVGF